MELLHLKITANSLEIILQETFSLWPQNGAFSDGKTVSSVKKLKYAILAN